MNKLKRILLVGSAAAFSVAHAASAMNYTNADLLLVFRQTGFNDVEFDIGSISNYLNRASGTQITVHFDTNLVKGNFNGYLSGVSFLLVAATAQGDPLPRLWLTDGVSSPSPSDVTYSKFSQIQSKLIAVGAQGSALSASNAAPVVVAPGTAGAYTYVASDGNLTPAATLGGLTSYPLEAVNPATIPFYEIHISTTSPAPASAIVGTFALGSNGVLTFTAGAQAAITPPTITRNTRSGTTESITFTTASGLNYQLLYATSLPGPWYAAGSSLSGDGSAKTLTDTSTDSARFYRIQVSH